MITIIGGSGFIGTRLCKRLNSSNEDFIIIDKADSIDFPEKVHFADVRHAGKLREAVPKESIIINLAAEHRDDVHPKSLYDEVNIQGAINICEVAREKGINSIIFISSVAVYGFAEPDTDENGSINYFNDYGRTKYLAEREYIKWYEEDSKNRSLVIIRPTVVFGEQNRGNVYNLLKQIHKGFFIMIGNGRNKKSMAYVENVAAFIEYSIGFSKGLYVYNYVDKPDFDMNTLIKCVRNSLGKKSPSSIRLPFFMGLIAGYFFDLASFLLNRNFSISSIRIKKFYSITQFKTSINKTNFKPPVGIHEGLSMTIRHEFLEDHSNEAVYHTE